MTTDSVLTDAQIFDCFDRQCAEIVMNFDADELYPVGRAIEQAVLQSAEVQALRKDIAEYVHIAAEQATEIEALLGLLKESRRQLPLAAACWNEDDNRDVAGANAKHVLELIARIDDAMEKQP